MRRGDGRREREEVREWGEKERRKEGEGGKRVRVKGVKDKRGRE